MAKLLNESGIGFEIKLAQEETSGSEWICCVLSIFIGGNAVFATDIKERRSLEKSEANFLINAILKTADNGDAKFEFEPTEPEFLLSVSGFGASYTVKYAVDAERGFNGLRSYGGSYLSVEFDVGSEELKRFADKLRVELDALTDLKNDSLAETLILSVDKDGVLRNLCNRLLFCETALGYDEPADEVRNGEVIPGDCYIWFSDCWFNFKNNECGDVVMSNDATKTIADIPRETLLERGSSYEIRSKDFSVKKLGN